MTLHLTRWQFVLTSTNRYFFGPVTSGLALIPAMLVCMLLPVIAMDSDDLPTHYLASCDYTIEVLTIVLAIVLRVVLACTAWTCHGFRRRLRASDFQEQQEA